MSNPVTHFPPLKGGGRDHVRRPNGKVKAMAIPDKVNKLVNEFDKQRLLNLFLTKFYGSHRAGKKRDFLKELYGQGAANNESYNNTHDRAFRLMVDALIDEDYPICSTSSNGYWYASSLNDGEASVAEGMSRAQAIRERAQKLEENLVKNYGGQMEMGI